MDNSGAYSNEKIIVRKIILSTQKNLAGESKIYVEILKASRDSSLRVSKKYKRVSTGVWVSPANWSKSKKEVLGKDLKCDEKNNKINEVYSKVLKYTNELDNSIFREETEAEFKTLIGLFPPAERKGYKGIVEYLDEYVAFRKGKGTPRGTWKEYITVKNRIIEFEKNANKKVYFEDINWVFGDEFTVFLSNEEYDPNTIKKTFSVLKTFLNHYHKRQKDINIHLEDTFKDREFCSVQKHFSDPLPLTRPEFRKLLRTKSKDPKLEKTRERFILQCTTGLRYSDLFLIKPHHIIDDCIELDPIKTEGRKENNTIRVNLNKYSRRILEKYGYDSTKLKISNSNYNDFIKLLFEELKFTTNIEIKVYKGLGKPGKDTKMKWELLTSHNARDTFITLAIEKGVDIPTIMVWTGQSSYEVMKKYIKTDKDHNKTMMKKVF